MRFRGHIPSPTVLTQASGKRKCGLIRQIAVSCSGNNQCYSDRATRTLVPSSNREGTAGDTSSAVSRRIGHHVIRPCMDDHRSAVSRSEEHTSELQSLMRSSYAVFCLKKKNKQ